MCQKHIYLRNLVFRCRRENQRTWGENLQKQVWTGNQMHTWLLDWESNSGPVVQRARKNHYNTCFRNKGHYNIDEWCPLLPPYTFNEWVASFMVYLVRSFHCCLVRYKSTSCTSQMFDFYTAPILPIFQALNFQ